MLAHEILATASNANAACAAAEATECRLTQNWSGDGSTTYLLPDGSVLVVSGAQVNAFDDAEEAASEWHNATPKAEICDWATSQKLDIGQASDTLDEDWNERVIDAYAAHLRAA